MATTKIQILPLRRAAPPSTSRRNVGRGGKVQSSSPSNTYSTAGDTDDSSVVTTPPLNKAPKVLRTSKPKVRTGCLTCKIRRVKCDEGKPACNRCTSTGRKCDGYAIPPRKKRSDRSRALHEATRTVSPGRCLQVVTGTPQELHALDFFHVRTAPGLASYFDADFWTRLVFQVANAEPAIKHAMIAVASLHQQRELGERMVPMLKGPEADGPLAPDRVLMRHGRNYDNPFAIAQYNCAIAALSKRLQNADTAVEVTLLACVLFVCVEFLRGDEEPAISHFKSGISIALGTVSGSGVTKAASTITRVKDYIMPVFNRLELLGMLFGQDALWQYSIDLSEAVPSRFRSVKEARDSIVHLMNLSLRFIRYMKFRRYDCLTPPVDMSRKHALSQKLIAWDTAFQTLCTSPGLTTQDRVATKVLRMHHCIVSIWLDISTYPAESAADVHKAGFETAVREAEEVHCNDIHRTTTFFFDMELVSPVYFICIKCRHRDIRRRAIALLRRTFRREGLWDSHMAAAIGERVMSTEELHLPPFDPTNPSSADILPAEADRIHNTHIESLAKGVNPNDHRVTFYAKPNGLYRHWTIRQDMVSLPHQGSVTPMGILPEYPIPTEVSPFVEDLKGDVGGRECCAGWGGVGRGCLGGR